MTAQSKATLKTYFESGDYPTESNFTDLIDSIPGDAGALGGALISAETVKAWAESGAYQRTAITYDGTYSEVMASATVAWPDGSAGTLTVDTINSTWRKIDAYHVTHSDSGKTVTQSAVTRNANGDITVKPALTIA